MTSRREPTRADFAKAVRVLRIIHKTYQTTRAWKIKLGIVEAGLACKQATADKK